MKVLGDFTVVDEKTIRFGFNAIKNLGSDVIANDNPGEGTGYQ